MDFHPQRVPVTAVVVSHNGHEWLADCLAALSFQTVRPMRVVAVDTGSDDDSVDLLRLRLGQSAVTTVAEDVALGDAVSAGLALADSLGSRSEWVWVIHDDCAPDRGALAALLTRAEGSPSIWVVGPKVRDWGGRRLVEFGATTDRVGHRETGIDRHELDQGQIDHRVESLAAGTAGLLVRRDAWEGLGGFDRLGWPSADDIDFGWRVHAAGGRVALAADAIVRHAAALTTGKRPHTEPLSPVLRRERGMQVVLANTSGWLAGLMWVRLVLGAVPRAIGLLVFARRASAARDELSAARGVIRDRDAIAAARHVRRTQRVISHREVRGQLAGVRERLRHLLEALRALTASRDPGVHRSTETGPVDESSEFLARDDTAALRWLLSRPSVALFLAAVLVALIAERGLFGSALAGGSLPPPPAGAHDLWTSYLASFHPFDVGTSATSPPALAVLALLSTLLLGKAWLAVDIVVLGCVPLSALTAWLATRRLTPSIPLRLWAAGGWAVLPAVTGAVTGGRIDVCAAAILLPLLARSMIITMGRFEPQAPRLGRWSRCLATGLLLGLVTAWTPVIWPITIVATAVALVVSHSLWHAQTRWLALLAIAAVGFVLCLPWSLTLAEHPVDMLAGLGVPSLVRNTPLPADQIVLFHPGGPGQPGLWVGAVLLLAAVAIASRRTRPVRASWALLVVGLAAAVLVSRLHGVNPGSPASRSWPGVELLVAAGGALAAVASATSGAWIALRRRPFGVVQPAAALLALAAVVAVAWSALHWIIDGAATPLAPTVTATAPLFVGDELGTATSPRAVIVTGRKPVAITVVRTAAGPDLSTAAVASIRQAAAQQQAGVALERAVGDLIAGRPQAARELAGADVQYVVASGPAAALVRQGAAAVGGFTVTPSPDLLVLHARRHTGELGLAAGSTARGPGRLTLLPAAPDGSAETTVSASTSRRQLVLAEATNPHWQATLNDRPLARTTVAGWEQAWQVPARASGRLVVGWNQPSRPIWLAIELVVLVIVAFGSLPLRRVEVHRPARHRSGG